MKELLPGIFVNLAKDSIEKSCERKSSYSTKELAQQIVEQRSGTGLDKLHAYHCKYADHWHIGHKTDMERYYAERLVCPYGCGRQIAKNRLKRHEKRCTRTPVVAPPGFEPGL